MVPLLDSDLFNRKNKKKRRNHDSWNAGTSQSLFGDGVAIGEKEDEHFLLRSLIASLAIHNLLNWAIDIPALFFDHGRAARIYLNSYSQVLAKRQKMV